MSSDNLHHMAKIKREIVTTITIVKITITGIQKIQENIFEGSHSNYQNKDVWFTSIGEQCKHFPCAP